jgi:hypothetical protein
MYEHPRILNMWTEKVFLPSIRAGKVSMGKPDLQTIVSAGFQATADLPMALYFEQVLEEFPDCKFILTTRNNSEEWFQSWNLLTKSISPPTFVFGWLLPHVRHLPYYLRWLLAVVNKDDSYLTLPLPLPHQQKEAAIASYEEHNRRVRQLIPPEKLLDYSVKDGWQPLCDFLQIETCPDKPFPRANSTRHVQVQVISSFLTSATIVLVCFRICFRLVMRKQNKRSAAVHGKME